MLSHDEIRFQIYSKANQFFNIFGLIERIKILGLTCFSRDTLQAGPWGKLLVCGYGQFFFFFCKFQTIKHLTFKEVTKAFSVVTINIKRYSRPKVNFFQSNQKPSWEISKNLYSCLGLECDPDLKSRGLLQKQSSS